MNEKKQDSCLMTTAFDEDTGEYFVYYIPLNINNDMLDFILPNGKCSNNHVVAFNLNCTDDKFWATMWKDLLEGAEND